MGRIGFSQFRQRFDPDLSNDILKVCTRKNVSLLIISQDKEYYSKVLRYDIEDDNPYIVLDTLMPEEGNELAKSNQEVSVKFDFLHKGSLYHVRFHMVLWGTGEEKGMQAIYSTPPLDIKLASENFMGKPATSNPLWVMIPLFKETVQLEVKMINRNGFVFEDRLIADTLPAVQKLDRVHLKFSEEDELVVPGSFRSGGGQRVEFKFEKVPDDIMRSIDGYLEKLFQDHSRAKPKGKKSDYAQRAKKSKAQRFLVLMLSEDNEYSTQLKDVMDARGVNLAVKSDVDEFYTHSVTHGWNFIIIDGQFSTLEMWDFTRGLQDRFKQAEKVLPPVAVLSDDLTEDFVVYAQYCGIQHIFSREQFPNTALKEFATITGHKELAGKSGEEDKGKYVVIIDDDKNVTFPLKNALNREGFSPVVVTKGSEGVRAAKDYKPGCIVMELAIRSGDGLDALRVLKKMPFTAKIPMMILTASKDDLKRQAASQHGADVYLFKPVDTVKLVERIKNLFKTQ